MNWCHLPVIDSDIPQDAVMEQLMAVVEDKRSEPNLVTELDCYISQCPDQHLQHSMFLLTISLKPLPMNPMKHEVLIALQ